eukprot:714497_1
MMRPTVVEFNGLKLRDGESAHQIGSFDDWVFVAGLAFMMGVLRYAMRHFLFVPLAKYLKIKSTRKRLKFADNMWFFVYYLPISIWEFNLATYHEIVYPMGDFFDHYPQHYFTVNLKLVFMTQLAFYGHYMVVTIFLEPRKSDFRQMVIHHCATIFLILGSLHIGTRNLTITVLVLHDCSDIFLFLGKALKCACLETPTNIVFAAFVLMFALTRLVYFPTVLYKLMRLVNAHVNYGWKPEVPLVYSCIMLAGLCVLFCLHLFWFRLILIIVKNTISSGKSAEDVRSDSEKDSD